MRTRLRNRTPDAFLSLVLLLCLSVAAPVAVAQDGEGRSTTRNAETAGEADGEPDGEAAAEKAPVSTKELLKSVLAQLKSKEEFDRQSGAIAALEIQDKKLFSPLLGLLKDKSDEVRFAAIRALMAREAPKERKSAAKMIAARLPRLSKHADTEGELLLSIEALDDLREPSTIPALVADMDSATRSEVVEARLGAVANIPHADAIDALIKLASSGRRRGAGGLAGRSARALRTATGENFGSDPDAWRAWWKDAKKTFDFDAAAEERDQARARQAEKERRRAEREERRQSGVSGSGGGSRKPRGKKSDRDGEGDADEQ